MTTAGSPLRVVRLPRRLALAVGCLLIVLGLSQPSRAMSSTFDLLPFTGDPVRVRVTLTELAGDIQFHARIVTDAQNPNTGDLRGLFFSFADNGLIPGLSATGDDITASKFSASPFKSVGGNSNNVNGIAGPGFEGGVEIGTQGIAADDIQDTTFLLHHASQTLSLSIFDDASFAARVMSVGLPGSGRGGSSKLSGPFVPPTDNPPPPPPPPGVIPEPVTAGSIAVALLGLTLGATRRRLR